MLESIFYIRGIDVFPGHQILDDSFGDEAFQYPGIGKGIFDIGIQSSVDALDGIPVQSVVLPQSIAHLLQCHNTVTHLG